MTFAQTNPLAVPLSKERRRYQRVRINLLGRYMLSDRREFPCQVVNVSPGGLALIAPVTGAPGERVIAYIDHVGRLEGVIVRAVENGFAMTIAATKRKQDKLAAQLTWLTNRSFLGLGEDRRHARVAPSNPTARLTLPDGVTVTCRVIDISESGVAIASDQRPEIGALISIGKTPARVVRHFADGFAAEFTRFQHADFLEENVTGG
jgi:hypothetical protein